MASGRSCNSDNAGPGHTRLAPHSGRVTNFCSVERGPIEPFQLLSGHCVLEKLARPSRLGAQPRSFSNDARTSIFEPGIQDLASRAVNTPAFWAIKPPSERSFLDDFAGMKPCWFG